MTKAKRAEIRMLWKSRLAEFKVSGQSTAKWCAAQGLKVHRLRYWVRKFKSEHEITKKQTQWLSVEIGELKADQPHEALPVRVGKTTI